MASGVLLSLEGYVGIVRRLIEWVIPWNVPNTIEMPFFVLAIGVFALGTALELRPQGASSIWLKLGDIAMGAGGCVLVYMALQYYVGSDDPHRMGMLVAPFVPLALIVLVTTHLFGRFFDRGRKASRERETRNDD